MPLVKRAAAELVGTFWLVLGGCGSAVLAAAFPHLGIGFLGVALAFGLTVVTMAYAVGHISGGHFNPAVSVGLAVARRFPGRELPAYVIAQLIGGDRWRRQCCTSSPRALPASTPRPASPPTATAIIRRAATRWQPALVCEVVMTCGFLVVILGATDRRAPAALAPLAIGLALTLIHLVSIPVTNTSVNPARSTGVALFAGGWALAQLWAFWVAPIVGAAIAGLLYPWLAGERSQAPAESRGTAATSG